MTSRLLPILAGALLFSANAVAAQDAPPPPEQAAPAAADSAAAETPAAAEQPAAEQTATEQTAAEQTGVAAGQIPPPPAGKGQVVFFRPSKLVGAAVSYKVREGETELGKLGNGRYFVHVADPGAHAYDVHSEVRDILNMEIDPGETYYVIGSLSVGVAVGRPNISPSDKAAFDQVAGKLKLSQ